MNHAPLRWWQRLPQTALLLAILAWIAIPSSCLALVGPVQSLPSGPPWNLGSSITCQSVTVKDVSTGRSYVVSDLTTAGVLGKANRNPDITGTRLFVSYSGSSSASSVVYWGLYRADLSLDGSSIEGNENLSLYGASSASLNAGQAEYRGSSVMWIYYYGYYSSGVGTRLRMRVTQNGSPVPLKLGSEVGASAPVVFKLTPGVIYTVELALEMQWPNNPNWYPALDQFDVTHTPPWIPTQYDVQYGYYYMRSPSGITLDAAQVPENSQGAVFIGNLNVSNPDQSPITFAVTSDPTSPTNLFMVAGNEVWAGRGFDANYYADLNLSSLSVRRREPLINNDWGYASPVAGVPANNISFRWLGRVYAPGDDWYTFRTISDDGVSLYLNGQLAINNWTYHAAVDNFAGAVYLRKDQPIDLEMRGFQGGGWATMRLLWARGSGSYKPVPGGITGQPFFDYETIPQHQYTLTISATDPAGQRTTQNLGIAIKDVNEAPYVLAPIPNQTVLEDFTNAFSLTGLTNYFRDPENNITNY